MDTWTFANGSPPEERVLRYEALLDRVLALPPQSLKPTRKRKASRNRATELAADCAATL